MDNESLNVRSEKFHDDMGEEVVKRCFFLLCGKDHHHSLSNYLTLRVQVNLFGDPKRPRKVIFDFLLENTVIELSREVIESQTMLLPEFRPFFRYDDLFKCKPNLHTKIQNLTPLYMVKQCFAKIKSVQVS